MRRTILTRLLLIPVAVLGASFAAGDARAATINFSDNTLFWDGFPSTSDAFAPDDNTQDVIGTPDLNPTINRGTATTSGGLLTDLQFTYSGAFSPVPGLVIPGDLFLDSGADGDWDYVLRLITGENAGGLTGDIVDVSGITAAYRISGADNAGYWSGYDIRNDHPYAWNAGINAVVGTGSVTINATTLDFDLGAGVNLGSTFIIGFAPNCANDVIYEVVPESGTFVLLFAGLSGLAFAGRRSA